MPVFCCDKYLGASRYEVNLPLDTEFYSQNVNITVSVSAGTHTFNSSGKCQRHILRFRIILQNYK